MNIKNISRKIKINTLYHTITTIRMKRRIKRMSSGNKLVITSTKQLAEIVESSINIDKFVLGEIKKDEKEFAFYIYGKECKFKLEEFHFGRFSKDYIMPVVYTDEGVAISLSNPIYLPDNEEVERFKVELEKFNNPIKFYGNYFSLPNLEGNKNNEGKPTLCNNYPFKFKSYYELELHFLVKALKEYDISDSFNEFITDCFMTEGNRNLYSFIAEDIRCKNDIAEKYLEGDKSNPNSIIDDIKTIRNIREKMISKKF